MSLTIVYDQRFGGDKVVFVNYMLEHGRAGLAVVEVAAEKDFVEEIVQKIESSASLHIFSEVCGVCYVAVAQDEGFVFAFQLFEQFDMLFWEIDDEGVPCLNDLGVM